MRALLVLVFVSSTAWAGPPSGYQCDPGKPNVGVGCSCPAGYASVRLDEDVAACRRQGDPDADLKVSCKMTGMQIGAGYTKVDRLADVVARPEQLRALGDAVEAECVRERWSAAIARCFAVADKDGAAWDCYEKLAPPARARLEAAVVGVLPPVIQVTDRIRITGRIAFAADDRVAGVSEPVLVDLARQLSARPGLRLTIRVHSDNVGAYAASLKRTQVRAETLKRLLLDQLKLPADRISAIGEGSAKPIEDNKTAAGRARNRRVDLAYTADAAAPEGPPAPPSATAEVRPPVAADLAGYLGALPGRGSLLRATIETSEGTLTCELLPSHAPMTVANFVGLATGQKPFTDPRSGAKVTRRYYDGLTFHRVIPGFMIQGGDPLGTGTGGPGYKFADEIHNANQVDAGSLVMANAGPNTNGGQFFISEARNQRLDASYTVFGRCTPLSVVQKIAAVPRGAFDKPTQPVVIKRVVIERHD